VRQFRGARFWRVISQFVVKPVIAQLCGIFRINGQVLLDVIVRNLLKLLVLRE
jgi:hypothetical protein